MPTKTVFICYCHADRKMLAELTEHLKNLRGLGFEVWSDQRIAAGSAWRSEIEGQLATCDAAIMLVSSRFLNSRFITDVEIPSLLRARSQRGAPIFPLLVESCNWQLQDWLAEMQLRPRDAKPLKLFGGPSQRAVVLSGFAFEVAEQIGLIRPPPTPAGATETVEVTIDEDPGRSEKSLMDAIGFTLGALSSSGMAIIERKRKGSLKLTVHLPAEAVARLRAAIEAGLFRPPGIAITDESVDIEVYEIDGVQFMIDETVAVFFERPVKQINQARDRNKERFADADDPRRYAFQLSKKQWSDLRSQSVTAKPGRGGRRSPPWAYTEEGVSMLATVLRTPAAAAATKVIVETFVEARRASQEQGLEPRAGMDEPDRPNDTRAAFRRRLAGFRRPKD